MRFEFGAVPGDRGLDLCCCGAPGAHADREASARSPSRRVGFPGCDPRVRVSVCTCPLCPAAFAGLARLRGACGSQCWCECTAARLPSGAWPAWWRGPVRRGGAGVPGGASAVSAYRVSPGGTGSIPVTALPASTGRCPFGGGAFLRVGVPWRVYWPAFPVR